MDNNRNEPVDHAQDDLVGIGGERPRSTDKTANARTNKDIRRGRRPFSGRAGEPSGGSGR